MSPPEATSRMTDFTRNIYAHFLPKKTEDYTNLFMSPLSLYSALAMTLAGAAGQTKQEMATGLGLVGFTDDMAAHQSVQSHLTQIHEDSVGATFAMSNRLFLEKTQNLHELFLNMMKNIYKAPAEQVDFIHKAEEARSLINNWVEKETAHKISDLLARGAVSDATRLVIVNAVYFKGLWMKPFEKCNTVVKEFFDLSNKPHNVQMMVGKFNLQCAEISALEAKMISMDFKQSNFRLRIILPDKRDGLPKLAAKLAEGNNLTETLCAFARPREVLLEVPRFKLGGAETMDMKAALISIGMASIFDSSKADFSAMSHQNLCVSGVYHKAVLEVNEEGAEAAAATGMVMNLRCAPMPLEPFKFKVDHPFVVAIVSGDNAPLFIGHVVVPEPLD